MARTHIGPVRFTMLDNDLDCRRVRGVGYRAKCDCGKDSGRLPTYALAREWLRAHKREEHS